MDLKQIRREDVNCICMAEERNQWRDLRYGTQWISWPAERPQTPEERLCYMEL